MEYTLFTQVKKFYMSLLYSLKQAKDSISMMYFTFDHGIWTERIMEILVKKAKEGVKVRLMVDDIGLSVDHLINVIRNRIMIANLRNSGIQVDTFFPKGRTLFHRLHCKMCAIDDNEVLLGGSNIGDYYLDWRDSNIALKGEFGDRFHRLYDFFDGFNHNHFSIHIKNWKKFKFFNKDMQIIITAPGYKEDIELALLNLISNANKFLYIRTWYFLPMRNVLNAMLEKASEGANVNVMLSNHTRVFFMDIESNLPCKKLVKGGVNIYRYTKKYMHSKIAWNDKNDVIIGSANLEKFSLERNFEFCLLLKNKDLALDLKNFFEKDKRYCINYNKLLSKK